MRAGAKRSKPAATAVWVVKRLPARVTASATSNGCPVCLHETAGTLQHGERRMPFIEMADFRLNAERGEQPPPADPENELLHEAQVRPAAVKLAGNASIRRKVRRVIAVQQVKLHSADLHLPGTQPYRVTRQSSFSRNHSPLGRRNGVIGN